MIGGSYRGIGVGCPVGVRVFLLMPPRHSQNLSVRVHLYFLRHATHSTTRRSTQTPPTLTGIPTMSPVECSGFVGGAGEVVEVGAVDSEEIWVPEVVVEEVVKAVEL